MRTPPTRDEIIEAFEALWREGFLVKTKQMRDGQPVYVAREFATEEELEADRKSRH